MSTSQIRSTFEKLSVGKAPVPLKRRGVELLIANFKPILDDFVRTNFGSDSHEEGGFVLKEFYAGLINDMDDWDHGYLKKPADVEDVVVQQVYAVLDTIDIILRTIAQYNLISLDDTLPMEFSDLYAPVYYMYQNIDGLEIDKDNNTLCGCVITYILRHILSNFSLLLQTVCDSVVDTEDSLLRLFEIEFLGCDTDFCVRHSQVEHIISMVGFLSHALDHAGVSLSSVFKEHLKSILRKTNTDGKLVFDHEKEDLVTPEGWEPLKLKEYLFKVPQIQERIIEIITLITIFASLKTSEAKKDIEDAIKKLTTDYPDIKHNFDEILVQLDEELTENKDDSDVNTENEYCQNDDSYSDEDSDEDEDSESDFVHDDCLLERKRSFKDEPPSEEKPAVRYSQMGNIYDDNLPRVTETTTL
jgi:hypothetical protein